MSSTRKLVCCGVSHKTLPLAERERIQPPRERWGEVLRALLAKPEILTGVLVVTCNRIEFYLKTAGHANPLEPVLEVLGAGEEVLPVVREASYVLNGDDAVRQLFRVAAGLDSMCIGESEVLGQIKEAYSLACQFGTVQHVMHRLFHAAFRVGKQIRSDTELGRGVRSMCGAALDLAADAAGGLEDKELLLVGINTMTRTIASRTRGLGRPVFINRTHCKATALARSHGGWARRFNELQEALVEADVVFTSTGSTEPILLSTDLDRVLEERGDRSPLVICDLAVPRDVEPRPAPDPRLVLLDQTAIQAHVLREDQCRRDQIDDAEEIVDDHVTAFWQKLDQGELTDSGQALMAGARRALERELEYCRRGSRSPQELALLEQFGRRLVDKVCSLGIVNLRAERQRNGGCPARKG